MGIVTGKEMAEDKTNTQQKGRKDMMENELKKELETRGTAEISNGVVNQVTQALNETDKEVEMLVFGELTKMKIKPISEVCPCEMASNFKSKEECQSFQKKDAELRGFSQLICPEQFID